MWRGGCRGRCGEEGVEGGGMERRVQREEVWREVV